MSKYNTRPNKFALLAEFAPLYTGLHNALVSGDRPAIDRETAQLRDNLATLPPHGRRILCSEAEDMLQAANFEKKARKFTRLIEATALAEQECGTAKDLKRDGAPAIQVAEAFERAFQTDQSVVYAADAAKFYTKAGQWGKALEVLEPVIGRVEFMCVKPDDFFYACRTMVSIYDYLGEQQKMEDIQTTCALQIQRLPQP